ncbi:MAG TPA: hypothetical protein VE263_20765 [Candidatus Angelobacter sp.]|nr:hypothetical protein [Candidatus Angelobacter sp.]
MTQRWFFSIASLLLALPCSTAAQSALPKPPAEVRATSPGLFERAIGNQKKAEEALDVYERIERLETRKNPNDPSPVSVKFARVIPSGTGMNKIPLDADGKPPDAAAYRARLEGLERALALLVNGARSQRDAVEKYAKRKRDRAELIDATRNAFLFKFIAQETRGELLLTKYEMYPNPAFKPTTRFTVVFPKVHGFVWIDENSGELARIEGDVTDDISIGLFLGKIYKGSHFMEERYEVEPGLWLPSFTQFDFDGRKLFSGFSIHERTFYSDYRYIGPPKEALEAIRKELGHIDLGKSVAPTADP